MSAKSWLKERWSRLRQDPPLVVTLLILLFSALIPITWFPKNQLIFVGDPVMAFDPARFFLERWSVWQGKLNLGYEPQIGVVSLVHQFIQAIPAFFGGSDRSSEIFHFTVWFILPGITLALFMHALTKRLTISRWAIPVAISYYLFNLYRLANFGDNNHFVVYATTPLLLYWVTVAFEPKRSWLTAAFGFVLSTLLASQAGSNPPVYLMLVIPVGLYGLLLTIAERAEWKRALKFWATALIGSFLANLYWIAPFVLIITRQQSLSAVGNLNWLGDLSRHTSFEHVVRLIGAWGWFDSWRGEAYAPFAAIYRQPFWYGLALVPALLAPIALFFRKAWKLPVVALFIIGLIGLAYAQGTHPPFGRLFVWTASHLPFFWIFRSPWYKFSNIQALGYAVMIGLSIGLLADWLKSKKSEWLIYLILVPVILLPIVLSHPLVKGTIWTTAADVDNLAPAKINDFTHIRQAAQWLNAQPGETGVALLPYQGASVYRWGYGSLLDPMAYLTSRPLFFRGDRIGYIPGNTNGASTAFRVFKEELYNGNPAAEQVARLLGIEYIIARNDIKYEFYDDTDSPAFIKDRLSKMPNIRLVKQFGDWDIYQLADARTDLVYSTQTVIKFDGHPLDSLGSTLAAAPANDPHPAVLYTRPITQPHPELIQPILDTVKPGNPPKLTIKEGYNRYTVSGTADQPFMLVLNQSFDTFWRLKGTGASFSDPVAANGYAPGWLIKPSGQFTITISYLPQQLILPTFLVSLITLLWLGFWAWWATRHHEAKRLSKRASH